MHSRLDTSENLANRRSSASPSLDGSPHDLAPFAAVQHDVSMKRPTRRMDQHDLVVVWLMLAWIAWRAN
jgi:hypothetical protein